MTDLDELERAIAEHIRVYNIRNDDSDERWFDLTHGPVQSLIADVRQARNIIAGFVMAGKALRDGNTDAVRFGPGGLIDEGERWLSAAEMNT